MGESYKKYQRADEFALAIFLISHGNAHRVIGDWLNVPFRTIGNWHRGKCCPQRRLPDDEVFDAKTVPEPNTGCLLWTGGYGGYGRFRRLVAHRYSWERAFGVIPAGMLVCHKCDTPACVNPDHLFLGTDLDNARDKITKGRALFGEKHPIALSAERVRRIASLRSAGAKYRNIAEEVGCSSYTIYKVTSGDHWSARK
jgi:hypothetical protein